MSPIATRFFAPCESPISSCFAIRRRNRRAAWSKRWRRAVRLVGYGSAYARELVEQDGGGQFVDAGDWRGLADCLVFLARDRGKIRDLIQSARASGRLHDRDKAMQRRIDLIKESASARRAKALKRRQPRSPRPAAAGCAPLKWRSRDAHRPRSAWRARRPASSARRLFTGADLDGRDVRRGSGAAARHQHHAGAAAGAGTVRHHADRATRCAPASS